MRGNPVTDRGQSGQRHGCRRVQTHLAPRQLVSPRNADETGNLICHLSYPRPPTLIPPVTGSTRYDVNRLPVEERTVMATDCLSNQRSGLPSRPTLLQQPQKVVRGEDAMKRVGAR